MFTEIRESLRHLYLKDAGPSLVDFSGGNGKSCFNDPHTASGRFDFVLANSPFNVNAADKETKGLLDEPLKGNYNYVHATLLRHTAPH